MCIILSVGRTAAMRLAMQMRIEDGAMILVLEQQVLVDPSEATGYAIVCVIG